jgi:hypothetical protein
MFYGVPSHLRDVAELQAGVLAVAQLVEGGLARDAASAWVNQGRWQRLHRGVYATFSGPPTRQAGLWAAVLVCGAGAMLSYESAAELAGLTDRRAELVHITIPADRRIDRVPGLVIHYSRRAREAAHPARRPPQTRVEETILDLVSVARTLDDASGWVTAGLGRRLTNQARLRHAVGLRGRMRWRPELTELLNPAAAGVHSPLEWRYERDVERPHGLPGADRQALARRNDRNEYRDRLYRAFSIAVELDGRAAHPADRRWADIRRDNAAAANRVITLRYGWVDVAARPCVVAAEVARVLLSRGYTGTRPCSPDCPVSAVVGWQAPPGSDSAPGRAVGPAGPARKADVSGRVTY